MLIPITVHVPEPLVTSFYERFGEFVKDRPQPGELPAPKRLEDGSLAPSWVDSDDAADIAWSLWKELSVLGASVLSALTRDVKDESRSFTPEQVAAATQHPKGASGVAGMLGGVGKAIRRAGLPEYRTPRGGSWHYVWDWDGTVFTMTPDVAKLLRKASYRRI